MRRTLAVAGTAAVSLIALSGTALAAGATYVSARDLGTPQADCGSTQSGWCIGTKGAGTVRLVDDAAGRQAGQHLELSTPTGTSDKAYALEYNNRGPLSEVETLSYEYLVTATGANPDWAPTINVEITTADGDSAVLVYEPLYADDYSRPVTGEWATMTPTSGHDGWWVSDKSLEKKLQAEQGDDKFGGATWEQVQATFLGATVGGIGLNQGTWNAGLTSQVDQLTVNDTTYDFNGPQTAADCKDDGWRHYAERAFPNQGQCIQFVNTGTVGRDGAAATSTAASGGTDHTSDTPAGSAEQGAAHAASGAANGAAGQGTAHASPNAASGRFRAE